MSVPAGERRIVSVLVADVAGSTSIAETLGPERSKFLFDEVVRLMREEVERFEGTVSRHDLMAAYERALTAEGS